ncbi:MAG: hypothetical protein EKK57_08905 [Proteobacteria bacterium]|nr:MAG: hypothetical protein EKK57_08905 [Pseudomonadota bacterium]
MPTLRPLRDYSEHEVIPFFTYSGSLPVNRGTVVKIVGSGFLGQDIALAGAVGYQPAGTLSERWTVVPQVAPVTATTDKPIGILLKDGREVDENGEQLKYRPRKAEEMHVFISGQNAPVVTEGVFHYSGISGSVLPGDSLYASTLVPGELTNFTGSAANLKVGTALSVKDSNGWAFIKLNVV